MKTMQLDNKVVRVREDRVEKKVSEGWKFVPKSLWKEQVRDVEKPEKPTETEEKSTKTKNNKMSKSAKRHLRNQKKK